MKRIFSNNPSCAQTAIEYLLVFAVVAIVALAAFNKVLPKIYQSQSPQFSSTGAGWVIPPNSFFSQVARSIQGDKPDPIDGKPCPVDPNSGSGLQPTCECPAPAFGGQPCS